MWVWVWVREGIRVGGKGVCVWGGVVGGGGCRGGGCRKKARSARSSLNSPTSTHLNRQTRRNIKSHTLRNGKQLSARNRRVLQCGEESGVSFIAIHTEKVHPLCEYAHRH